MPKNSPKGFTLVEMLVATALVLLMMVMFAQIFQTAGGLVSNQKGMAEQDQNARTLTILLRGDMKSRTFVDVVPFQAGQNTDPSVASLSGPNYDAFRRRGFFSISENNPTDSTDDVLHLTITTDAAANTTSGNSPYLPYSGRASFMYSGTTAPPDQNLYLLNNPDQPEFDDGQVTVNQTGSSRYAEVCWFLRNGTLYRRQLLVRDPYSRNGNTGEEPKDSGATASLEFIDTTYAAEDHVNRSTNFSGVFWRDFDYSAYTDLTNNLKFHSMPEALENLSNSPAGSDLAGFPRSLGIPFLRFGSSVDRAQGIAPNIQIFGPREFLDPADASTFIGRFTVEETTHNNFAYPGNRTSATDPFNSTASGPTLNLINGTVDEYKYGYVLPGAHPTKPNQTDVDQRRGEDIVMSNVHSFDIQVWDDELRDFANLGHNRRGAPTTGYASGRRGWYHRDFYNNPNFANDPTGDNTGVNHYSYDTWHPFEDTATTVSMPATPFRPLGTDPELYPYNSLGLTNLGLGSDAEVPLRAIRILIRFYDINSDSMRDLTFTFPLNS